MNYEILSIETAQKLAEYEKIKEELKQLKK
jgi:hypothetical protein